MNYLSVEQLAKSYGERILFSDISFGLAKGDKVALIANNGTGKSTLLRILAHQDVADSGSFNFRDGIRVAFLDQDPKFNEGLTIEAYIQQANAEILGLIDEYHSLSTKSAEGDKDALKRLESVQSEMDIREAWDYDRRLGATLSLFGIHDQNQLIDTLSGGQKKRLALAVALVDKPDFLILDEPTNHLDIDMVEWLESFLSASAVTVLMVTHDRYFLDRVCNVILEMHHGKLYRHQGNYAYFLLKRAEREEALQTEIDKAGKLMKKELEWMRRQPKARTTKSKSRIDAFYDIEAKAKSGIKDQELKLDVKMSRVGGKILELKKVYKAYGELEILKGFDYTFKKGERIGIIGKNGVGKTTFLNILTGKEKPDSGKVNVGETIVYGYYNQAGLQLKNDKRVIEVLKDIAEVIVLSDGSKLTASAFLQHFMFSPEMQYTFVSKLSGGERRRLHLMTVLMKNPNFLILDEPTNDLDLLTLQKLEEFLENFGGCLMVVSHDRYFLDKLIDHLFVFEGQGQIRDFWGQYSDFKEEQKQIEQSQKVDKKRESAEQKAPPKAEPIQKLSYKHKFELEQLEKDMPQLEKKKATIEKQLQQADVDYETLQKTGEELAEVSRLLDEKMLRWMELEDLKTND
ncbi:MAG: ABC-F family ATP-binding cassette domain-containing protein [Salibacteraceae bacterium]